MEKEKQPSETITIRKDSLWKYSAFILLGILVIGAFFVLSGKTTGTGNIVADNPSAGNLPAPSPQAVQVNADDDAVMGDKNAPVTIIEFSDYQCPFCRKFWQETLPQIKQNYVDTGKVKFVYRDFPLNFHEGAIPYAEAANCARENGGDEAYFKMHDKIFEEQNVLDGGSVSSTVQYPGAETLKQWARDLGYDISSCLDSGKYQNEIQKDFADGGNAGVQGTPGFFINGKPLSGAQPYFAFKQFIEAELSG
ncbi:MAG: DsbA family protein [Nanoarchaeota archaeon]|mgnify:FL=1